MHPQHNEAAARRLFELLSVGDIDGVLALMTEDATWRIPGKQELSPSAGVYARDRIGRLFHRMLAALSNGLQMTVRSCVAEGGRVAVEALSCGDLKNGRRYRQEYHFLIEFRDGKICAVREYLDTQHAHDVWIAEVSSQEPSAADLAREFWRLMASNDFASVGAVLASDFVLEWPQSCERIRGAERFARMNQEYPAHGRWQFTVNRITGGMSEAVSDVDVTDGVQRGRALSFFTVAQGKITRIVEFWPEPYAAPANRAHLVELME